MTDHKREKMDLARGRRIDEWEYLQDLRNGFAFLLSNFIDIFVFAGEERGIF